MVWMKDSLSLELVIMLHAWYILYMMFLCLCVFVCLVMVIITCLD